MKPGQGIYAAAYRLGHAFYLSGDTNGGKSFVGMLKKKLKPLLANDRNDHDQERAGKVLDDVISILNGSMSKILKGY